MFAHMPIQRIALATSILEERLALARRILQGAPPPAPPKPPLAPPPEPRLD